RQLAWLEGEAVATRPAPLPGRSQAPAATTPARTIEPSGPVRAGDYAGDMGYDVPDYGPAVPPAALYRYYYGTPYGYGSPYYGTGYYSSLYSYGLGYPYFGSYGPYYYYPSGLSVRF